LYGIRDRAAAGVGRRCTRQHVPGPGRRPGRDQDQQDRPQRRSTRAHPGADRGPGPRPAPRAGRPARRRPGPDRLGNRLRRRPTGTGGPAYRPAAPHRTEHTIDCGRFEREPAAAPARTMSVSTPAALLDAAEMIRALLWDAQHTTGWPVGAEKLCQPMRPWRIRAARRRAGHGGGHAENSRASWTSDPSARPLVRDVVDKRIFGKGRQRATPISPVLLVRQVQVLHRDTRRSVASAGRDDGPAAQRALHGHLVADHALGSVAAMAPSLACRAGAAGWLGMFRGVPGGSGP
jgi:hypothetical protein